MTYPASFGGGGADRPSLPELAKGVLATIDESRAENTRRAYRGRFLRFRSWCDLKRFEAMPADPRTVMLYAEDLFNEGLVLTTVEAYISTISVAHRTEGKMNPCEDMRVKLYMDGKRRLLRGRTGRQALALSENDILDILVALPKPRVSRGGHREIEESALARSKVDRALLLTMIQAGLRRSEAEELRWQDVDVEDDGSGRITVRFSKTDQTGRGAVVAVKENCLKSLQDIRPEEAGDADRVFDLSGGQICKRLKRMCQEAGLDPARITGHTPRVTLARLMGDKGAPTHVIQRQGRWQTPGMVMLYTRAAQAGEALRWL